MPSWGRPSGARHAKRRKDRGVYTRQREEEMRFEEIDSDSDDGQGVVLDGSFAGDELKFTGADLGAYMRNRQPKKYRYDSEASDEDEDLNVTEQSGGVMQLALRDKEELLVQKALERIRRAQALGKTNVKLSQSELDALERKRRKDQSKRKPSGTNLRPNDKRRASGTSSPALKEQKSGNQKRKSSLPRYDPGDIPSVDYTTNASPGLLLPGHSGPSFAPLGYYPSTNPLSQVVGPDSNSRHSPRQQRITSNVSQHSKARDKHKRNSSGLASAKNSPSLDVSDASRRLPDDPGWSPRSRSASSNHPYVVDPYQYQQYSPPLPQMPPQYTQNRRVVSSPPDVPYPDIHNLNARRAVFPTQQPHATSSEPSLLRMEHSDPRQLDVTDSDENSGDSENYGVQVNVVPYGEGGYDVRVESESPSSRQRREQR
ncbi:MAG: hypothetical protein Q9195_001831 [Heterodermia aff. obscurata]